MEVIDLMAPADFAAWLDLHQTGLGVKLVGEQTIMRGTALGPPSWAILEGCFSLLGYCCGEFEIGRL